MEKMLKKNFFVLTYQKDSNTEESFIKTIWSTHNQNQFALTNSIMDCKMYDEREEAIKAKNELINDLQPDVKHTALIKIRTVAVVYYLYP